MKEKEAETILEELNEEHDLDLDVWDVLDLENITAEEFRSMALRAGGIEEEAEPEEPELEEEPLDISEIRDPDRLYELWREAEEKKHKAEYESRREKRQRKLRKLRGQQLASKLRSTK